MIPLRSWMFRFLLLPGLFLTGPLAAHDWNGLAIDSEGHLYVVDAEDGQIWKVSSEGVVKVFVPGTRAVTMNHPHHLAIDAAGCLWTGSG